MSFAASGQCTVSGDVVHIKGAGTCFITASQAGNGSYNAAPDVLQTFNISKAATRTTLTSSANPSGVGQSVTFTATVTSTAGVPSNGVQFKVDGINQGAPVALNASGVATFNTGSLTPGTHTVTADYSGDSNFAASSGLLTNGPSVSATLLQFGSSSYNVNEADAAGVTTITVNRTGDTSAAVSVDYFTSDTSALIPCQTNGNGIASDRCDYATAKGTLRFAAGEITKSIKIPLINDAYVEPDESFSISLRNPQGAALGTSTATVIITSEDTQTAA